MRHGYLLIHKPVGPTSHDIVGQVRRTLSERNIGHLGTLDPLASGLMVLAVGNKALKTVELFQHASKEYIAEATLGATSTTYDSEGIISPVTRPKGGEPSKDLDAVQVMINKRLVGKIEQIPPVYSAVSIGGERAYRKARQGIPVTIPPRQVEIQFCNILSYDYPKMTLHIACSSGTYVRTIIYDLGELLRCGAYMSALERTKVGEWDLKDAVTPEDATWTDVMPLKDIMHIFKKKEVTAEEWAHLEHGRTIEGFCTANTIAWFDGLPCAILENDPKHAGRIKPRKVL